MKASQVQSDAKLSRCRDDERPRRFSCFWLCMHINDGLGLHAATSVPRPGVVIL